ncbi:MAG TPA: ATPase [Firmicutes bacterium]|nr:ATPase [Bacillota bacterium]
MQINYEHYFKNIVGREKELASIIAAINCGRHVLLEGPPGTSKSTILRTVTRMLGLPMYIIEGNVDLTPAKLVGYFNPGKVLQDNYDPEYFEKGPLTMAMEEGGILYIEEFNRMPSDVANVLITPMEEGELNIPRYGKIIAKNNFTVVATQNPYDDVGTVRISRAFMDRICRIALDYQTEEEEIEIVRRLSRSSDERLIQWAVKVVRQSRRHDDIRMGASVRAAHDIVALCESLQKAGLLTAENLREIVFMSLSSKIWLSELTTKKAEQVIEEILDTVADKEGNSYSPSPREIREKKTIMQ